MGADSFTHEPPRLPASQPVQRDSQELGRQYSCRARSSRWEHAKGGGHTKKTNTTVSIFRDFRPQIAGFAQLKSKPFPGHNKATVQLGFHRTVEDGNIMSVWCS